MREPGDKVGGNASCSHMIVPHSQLQPATLRAIVLEFVTRDGTDHSNVDARSEQVLAQLAAHQVELDFDDVSQSCNIVIKSQG